MSHQVWLPPPPQGHCQGYSQHMCLLGSQRKRPWGRNKPRHLSWGCFWDAATWPSCWHPELAQVATFSGGPGGGPGEAPGNVISLLVVLCPTESQEFCNRGARGRRVTEMALGPCHMPWVWRTASQRPPLSPCPQLPRRLLPRGRSSSCP